MISLRIRLYVSGGFVNRSFIVPIGNARYGDRSGDGRQVAVNAKSRFLIRFFLGDWSPHLILFFHTLPPGVQLFLTSRESVASRNRIACASRCHTALITSYKRQQTGVSARGIDSWAGVKVSRRCVRKDRVAAWKLSARFIKTFCE